MTEPLYNTDTHFYLFMIIQILLIAVWIHIIHSSYQKLRGNPDARQIVVSIQILTVSILSLTTWVTYMIVGFYAL